jgi:hypothetical protein
MDFLYRLDNTSYCKFKVEVVNDMQKGLAVNLDDLNKMYMLLSRRVVLRTGKDAGRATFTTIDRDVNKKGRGKSTPVLGVDKMKQEKHGARLAKMKCFNCGEKGHPSKSYPHKLQKDDADEEEKPPLAGMTLDVCSPQ